MGTNVAYTVLLWQPKYIYTSNELDIYIRIYYLIMYKCTSYIITTSKSNSAKFNF